MNQYRPTGFRVLPTVVKNLLILNILFYIADLAIKAKFNVDLSEYLGLHYVTSESFYPHQFITYMFMHDTNGLTHILFNMFALWMFGSALENFWGPKNFLIYYFVTGIGAAVVQMIVNYIQISYLESTMAYEQIQTVLNEGYKILQDNKNYMDPAMGQLNLLLNSSTIGASGAVFGLLLAFGMMFPNALIYIYFFIPMKAKYFVMVYGAIELASGLYNAQSDNVAHFAHLGGMIFGFFLIKAWRKKKIN
ncbi:MAG: rhomboid family intramembrane serine protease [Bacteroidetes bacterium HGW-Bacteroidetes-21]|jgi:membrane associated rhomboid family serine protease|nr:MAG: rhomboid family intramembrane serine protease [Bacteroidetes bacterium HGW-Bacteroidetes-21]